jgi:hypothetical protein
MRVCYSCGAEEVSVEKQVGGYKVYLCSKCYDRDIEREDKIKLSERSISREPGDVF